MVDKYKLYTWYIYSICGYNSERKDGMNIIISNSSGEPIYEQIRNQIRELIISDELKEGDNLPSIRNLARELKISVITTKRAYEELERDGFIETIPGKGSFVAAQNKELLREIKMKNIEEYLIKAIEEGRNMNISLEELKEMLDVLYE